MVLFVGGATCTRVEAYEDKNANVAQKHRVQNLPSNDGISTFKLICTPSERKCVVGVFYVLINGTAVRKWNNLRSFFSSKFRISSVETLRTQKTSLVRELDCGSYMTSISIIMLLRHVCGQLVAGR